MRHILYLLPAAVLLASCTQDDRQDNPLADGPVALSVIAEISTTTTRASATSFETGDPIGIFPLKDEIVEEAQANKKYVSDPNSRFGLTSDDPYYFYDAEEVTFFAYYPYDESLTAENNTIAINTRAENQIQSTISGTDIAWRMNDYLSASAATTVSSPTVYYTGYSDFEHVMSRVIFVFKAGTESGITDLEGLTGYMLDGLAMEGTFDVTTGKAKPTDTANKESLTMKITDASGETYTCDPLILLPQTIDGDLTLEVTYNGVTYTAGLTPPTGGLQAGYTYTYTVTVNAKGFSISDPSIGWSTGDTGSGSVTVE